MLSGTCVTARAMRSIVSSEIAVGTVSCEYGGWKMAVEPAKLFLRVRRGRLIGRGAPLLHGGERGLAGAPRTP